MSRRAIIGVLLVVTTLAVYSRTVFFPFITLDDNQMITNNPMVRRGLSAQGVGWAFSLDPPTGYSPLAWLSHMVDCTVFGVERPGSHHAVNVLLHAISVALLFILLMRMTGALWRSAAVALLLAVHPLHVESVAWISERRDVLSMFGCMLTLLAYVEYVRRPGFGRYLLVVAGLLFALLSKPLAVTLPCIMLLLDYWPLNRFTADRRVLGRLFVEKLPLLALAGVSSVLTFMAQSRFGAVQPMEVVSLGGRLQNVIVAYGLYLWKIVRPIDLAAHYAIPAGHPVWHVILTGVLLVAISIAALRLARPRPYLIVGWLWYLGALVPMIGLITVGRTWMADRYAYLPAIGVYIALVWGVADLRPSTRAVAIVATSVFAVLAVLTWTQIGYWRDSIVLYNHALHVVPHNPVIHNNLANALFRRDGPGDRDDAVSHYLLALQQKRDYWEPRYNFAKLLMYQRRFGDAIALLREAHDLADSDEKRIKTIYLTGIARMALGELDEAERLLRRTLLMQPDYPRAREQLDILLKMKASP